MTFNINDLPAVPGASRRVLPERKAGGVSLSTYSGPQVHSNPSAPSASSAQSAQFPDSAVRLSEVVSALSYALDITEGQPQGHAIRTCLIGMRLAEVVRLTDQERSALFYALLLKDLGCSSNAARLCSLFSADDLTLKRAHKLTDWTSGLASAGYALSHVAPHRNPLARAWQVLQLGTREKGSGREMTATRCERGADIARMLGLEPATQHAIRALDEQWDGSGMPLGLKGNDISLLGRIAGLAQTVEVFAHAFGPEEAYEVARRRRARWFDPELVMAILRDMAKAHPKTLADPSPVALCTGFGESGLNFEVRVWTARTEDAETLLSQLAVSVHRALTAAKIEIAFPQREVHIRNTDDRLPIASASSGLTS